MLFLPQHVMLLKSFETFKSEAELHLVVFNCNIHVISSTSGFVVHLSFEACTSRLKLLKAVFVNFLLRFDFQIFLDMEEKEIENINKIGCRASKHVELWVRNVFDEWWVFRGFNIEKFIIDIFEDEDFVMNLVEMFFKILQVVKKDGTVNSL
jgi:hypothetical protein